jgi:hypothetical protein
VQSRRRGLRVIVPAFGGPGPADRSAQLLQPETSACQCLPAVSPSSFRRRARDLRRTAHREQGAAPQRSCGPGTSRRFDDDGSDRWTARVAKGQQEIRHASEAGITVVLYGVCCPRALPAHCVVVAAAVSGLGADAEADRLVRDAAGTASADRMKEKAPASKLGLGRRGLGGGGMLRRQVSNNRTPDRFQVTPSRRFNTGAVQSAKPGGEKDACTLCIAATNNLAQDRIGIRGC